MTPAISIDFETFFSRKLKYSLKKMIAAQYCGHSLFDAYIVSVCDGKSCWAGHPRDLNWAALDGKTWLSHNQYFDSTVYAELVKRGIVPVVKQDGWYCTANMTSYLCNRRALDQAVEHLLKIKLSKQARSDSDGKHWPEDFSEDERAAMLDYARKDAFYTWTLWDKFNRQWPVHERALSALTIRQGQRGVQINRELLDSFIMRSFDMKAATEKLIPWIADAGWDEDDEFNLKPTSTKCIAEQCRRSGIPCPPIKADEGEEAYQEWEDTYTLSHSWVAALTSWRSINKLFKTFNTAYERLRPDGTLPFGLKYFGAHTGRWSGAEGINFQNFRRKSVLANELGLLETNEDRVDQALSQFEESGKYPEWVKYPLDFRHLIIPRPGKKMIVSDLAQIEPRVLAWLCKDGTMLEAIKSGMSIYEAEARFSMGFSGDKLPKNTMVYQEAKARRLALGYGAGWKKFIVMAQQYTGLKLTDERSQEVVAAFRSQNPKIVGLWDQLDSAFKRSVGGDFTMTLPSGRKMLFRDVRCGIKIERDEQGNPKRKTVFTCEIGGRRVETYGGKLTENVDQAASRDVFAGHLLALDDTPGIDVLFSSHDEAITECDENIKPSDVEEIMSVTPEYMPGLPVGAEAKEVPHYVK